jgi:hypothetical protein
MAQTGHLRRYGPPLYPRRQSLARKRRPDRGVIVFQWQPPSACSRQAGVPLHRRTHSWPTSARFFRILCHYSFALHPGCSEPRRPRRHLVTASGYREIRTERHAVWRDITLAGVRS